MKKIIQLSAAVLVLAGGFILSSCDSNDFEDDRQDYYDAKERGRGQWARDNDIQEAEMDLKEQFLKDTRY